MHKHTHRHIEVDMHGGLFESSRPRLKVTFWRFDKKSKVRSHKTYRETTKSTMNRLFDVLDLWNGYDRPDNVRVSAGFGSLSHLSLDVNIDGQLVTEEA